MRKVRIGVIDGAIGNPLAHAVTETRSFNGADAVEGHGSMVAHCILDHCSDADIVSAQVFDKRRIAPVDVIVEAIEWLVERDVELINMSFGMRSESLGLTASCRSAARQCILVAAAPSHGPVTYPSAIKSCLAVTGDARCQWGEIAWLGLEKCDFGTHPFLRPGRPQYGGGASVATARMTGLIAEMLRTGASAWDLHRSLAERAAHIGPEVLHA